MSSCTRIRIREIPEGTPSNYLASDGNLYLDTGANFSFANNVQIEELTDFEAIQANSDPISSSLPATPKNLCVLDAFINPLYKDQEYKPIEIDIIQNSCVNSDNTLIVLNCSSDGINIIYGLGAGDWATKMQSLKICDLDLGTWENKCQTATTAQTDCTYTKGQTTIYTPLINYGDIEHAGYDEDGCLIISKCYLRPLVFAKAILDAIGCACGFNIDIPVFEEEDFLKKSLYLLDKNIFTDQETLDDLSVVACVEKYQYHISNISTATVNGTFINSEEPINFENVILDPGNNYYNDFLVGNLGVSGYNGCACVNVKIEIIIELEDIDYNELPDLPWWGPLFGIAGVIFATQTAQDPVRTPVELKLVRHAVNDATGEYSEVLETIELEKGMNTINIEKECICNFGKGETGNENILGLVICKGGTDQYFGTYTVHRGTYIIEAVQGMFECGESYEVAKLLDCNISALDVFKGLIHPYNIKLDSTQIDSGTLFGAPPYANEDGIGYFDETKVIDLSDKIIDKTRRIERDVNSLPRYVKLKFKDSTDCVIENKKLNDQLYCHTIDRGEEYTNLSTQVIENALFEPTINEKVGRVVVSSDSLFYYVDECLNGTLTGTLTPNGVSVPFRQAMEIARMCGKEGEDKYGWDIGPRMLHNYGAIFSGVQDDGANSTLGCVVICDESSPLLPLAAQILFCPRGNNGDLTNTTYTNYHWGIVFNGQFGNLSAQPNPADEDFNYLYGDPEKLVGNHFLSYWKRYLLEQVTEACVYYEARLCGAEIDQIKNFRTCITHTLDGKPVTSRVEKLIGVDRCLDSLEIKVRPITDSGLIECGSVDGYPPNGGCNNFAQLECEKTEDGCFSITIGGVFSNPVISSIINLVSGTGTITQTSPLTATLCDASGIVEIQALVQLEAVDGSDCELVIETPIKSIDSCGNIVIVQLDCRTIRTECPDLPCDDIQIRVTAQAQDLFDPNTLVDYLFVSPDPTLHFTVNGVASNSGQVTIANQDGSGLTWFIQSTHQDTCNYSLNGFSPNSVFEELITLSSDDTTKGDCEEGPCENCFEIIVNGDFCAPIEKVQAEVCLTNEEGEEENMIIDIDFSDLENINHEICGPYVKMEIKNTTPIVVYENDCEDYFLPSPIVKEIPLCCCEPEGHCGDDCLFVFSKDCGRKTVWYKIVGAHDKTVVPYELEENVGQIDNEIKEKLKCEFPIFAPVGTPFTKNEDVWYVGIMTDPKEECDCLLFPYFHDAPYAGENDDKPILTRPKAPE